MDATAIFDQLKPKFGDAIVALVSTSPDPFVIVDRKPLVEICAFLKKEPNLEMDYLVSIAGLDLKDKLQVVYHLWSYKHRHGLTLKVELAPTDLAVPSLCGVWKAANWLEREQYDLFGFTFTGHPDLRRIMLPEDWVGHPLRKDYVFPDDYHGISCQRTSPFEQFKALDDLEAKSRPAAETPPRPNP